MVRALIKAFLHRNYLYTSSTSMLFDDDMAPHAVEHLKCCGCNAHPARKPGLPLRDRLDRHIANDGRYYFRIVNYKPKSMGYNFSTIVAPANEASLERTETNYLRQSAPHELAYETCLHKNSSISILKIVSSSLQMLQPGHQAQSCSPLRSTWPRILCHQAARVPVSGQHRWIRFRRNMLRETLVELGVATPTRKAFSSSAHRPCGTRVETQL